MRRALLVGTISVGALDISDAIFFWFFYRGVRPTRILQSVAAGFLGREQAFQGGIPVALLGLGIHFFIAFSVVLVYNLAAGRLPGLVQYPITWGAVYGLLVYLFMYFVVFPLSALGPPAFNDPIPVINNVLIHILGVGIPAGLSTRFRTR